MSLLLLGKQARALGPHNKPARLYKMALRELPRVMAIYDIINIGHDECKAKIRSHFYRNADVKDERVVDMLVEKGYIDLEDTLLQHKQKAQLMLLLEGSIGTEFNSKHLGPDASEEEQFQRWMH